MPRFDRAKEAEEANAEDIDLDDRWRPRPTRLLLGLGLIALALAWSVLNGTVGGYKHSTIPVVHGPAPTQVQTLAAMRVRPELPRGGATPPMRVAISFHNDGPRPRVVSPHDLRLILGRQTLYPLTTPRGGLSAVVVKPGHYVSAVLTFARPLAPGAVLLFAPPWSAGRRLQWPLWT